MPEKDKSVTSQEYVTTVPRASPHDKGQGKGSRKVAKSETKTSSKTVAAPKSSASLKDTLVAEQDDVSRLSPSSENNLLSTEKAPSEPKRTAKTATKTKARTSSDRRSTDKSHNSSGSTSSSRAGKSVTTGRKRKREETEGSADVAEKEVKKGSDGNSVYETESKGSATMEAEPVPFKVFRGLSGKKEVFCYRFDEGSYVRPSRHDMDGEFYTGHRRSSSAAWMYRLLETERITAA